jgi:hypothetical protein
MIPVPVDHIEMWYGRFQVTEGILVLKTEKFWIPSNFFKILSCKSGSYISNPATILNIPYSSGKNT